MADTDKPLAAVREPASHQRGALILITEVARQLGVRPEVIANSKELPPFWLGGRRYLFREDYLAWRDRNRRNAP